MRLSSPTRFLAVYSGVLTVAFAFTVIYALNGMIAAKAADSKSARNQNFDQITVRRIILVEPDGTPRLVIAGKANFPGAYFKGKEIKRTDRAGYAGMIFLDDEGTENGGLIFGGRKSSDGVIHSFGHLSFDEYESNQSLSLDTSQQGENTLTSYTINDNEGGLRTPEVLDALEKARQMPEGPERQKAIADIAKYHIGLTQRANLTRNSDKSVALQLRDTEGRPRIQLRVAPDGTPSMQFLDASGKILQQWPTKP
jgi:hypothetical protein